MSSPSVDRRYALVGPTALVALFIAGIVLAISPLVAVSDPVLATAWLVAFAAMAFVGLTAFRDARATGIGFFMAVGRTFKVFGRFILAFF